MVVATEETRQDKTSRRQLLPRARRTTTARYVLVSRRRRATAPGLRRRIRGQGVGSPERERERVREREGGREASCAVCQANSNGLNLVSTSIGLGRHSGPLQLPAKLTLQGTLGRRPGESWQPQRHLHAAALNHVELALHKEMFLRGQSRPPFHRRGSHAPPRLAAFFCSDMVLTACPNS
ncbi:hypothetical protein BC567DRAFT_57213 [Phyllosticta citribraziliensis]